MDTYELAERHDFFPSLLPSRPPRRPALLLEAGSSGFIDVELPASHSAQHAVGLEFRLLPAESKAAGTETGARLLEVRREEGRKGGADCGK
jgi:hypothetical protein